MASHSATGFGWNFGVAGAGRAEFLGLRGLEEDGLMHNDYPKQPAVFLQVRMQPALMFIAPKLDIFPLAPMSNELVPLHTRSLPPRLFTVVIAQLLEATMFQSPLE